MESTTERQAITTSQLLQKVGAEMVGTFALVFAGCGAIMVDARSPGSVGHVGVSLTFGLVIAVMVAATGHISGAHFNPAVTLAFATTGRFPWRQVPGYIIGQCLAALAAAAALGALIGGPVAQLGSTQPSVGPGTALVLEIVITFFLMFVIFAVATDSRAVGAGAGPAIGGTVAVGALFAGPLTGASMNPARSLGPALASGTPEHLWLYIVGPIIGAQLGAWVYRCVCCDRDDPSQADGCC
jgi:MIP family channel proteins